MEKNYQLMACYNQWINERLYGICATLPDELRKRDMGAFFKSIHGTLNHILYGDRAWLGRFTDTPFAITDPSAELYADFAELQRERRQTDSDIIEWSKSLQPEWLHQHFEYVSNIDGQTRSMPTWILVTHFFNHQTHHRGQITTLLMQSGHDPGPIDIPWMPR